MHTIYLLEISSLSNCYSLLKLDLSKNMIRKFPYLGHLRQLRIIFIHQNLLDIQDLVNIF